MNDQAALAIRDFARALGVSIDSVRRAIRRGDIRKIIHFGRRVLIPRSELERILEGDRKPAREVRQ